jgi:ADP-ribose pyrophosphatase YjhB (NUDIX family)
MTPEEQFLKYPTGKIKKGEFCGKCGRYNSRYAACNVALIDGKKILLIKRGHQPFLGYWALPGGYLDWDETTEECALRELKEETGYTGKNPKLILLNSDPGRDYEGRQNLEIFFSAEIAKKSTGHSKEEVSELGWFLKKDLPEKMIDDHKKAILSLPL